MNEDKPTQNSQEPVMDIQPESAPLPQEEKPKNFFHKNKLLVIVAAGGVLLAVLGGLLYTQTGLFKGTVGGLGELGTILDERDYECSTDYLLVTLSSVPNKYGLIISVQNSVDAIKNEINLRGAAWNDLVFKESDPADQIDIFKNDSSTGLKPSAYPDLSSYFTIGWEDTNALQSNTIYIYPYAINLQDNVDCTGVIGSAYSDTYEILLKVYANPQLVDAIKQSSGQLSQPPATVLKNYIDETMSKYFQDQQAKDQFVNTILEDIAINIGQAGDNQASAQKGIIDRLIRNQTYAGQIELLMNNQCQQKAGSIMNQLGNEIWEVVLNPCSFKLLGVSEQQQKPTDQQQQCREDDDCGSQQVCEQGQCIQACRTDSNCEQGYVCDNGHCVQGQADQQQPAEQPIPGEECQSDNNCAINQECYRGACITRQCEDSGDCPFGYECLQSLCISIEEGQQKQDEPEPASQIQGLQSCREDDDCDTGFSCVTEQCIECQEDNHCAQGARCIDGLCIECQSDNDCGQGEVCSNGKCIESGEQPQPQPQPQPAVETIQCRSDQDCPQGYECAENSICVETEEAAQIQCNTDADCPQGYECAENSVCVETQAAQQVQCQSDADCQTGYECAENSVCVETQAAQQVQCQSDADCQTGYECAENSICVETQAAQQVQCQSDADCQTGYECAENSVCVLISETTPTPQPQPQDEAKPQFKDVCVVPYLDPFDESANFMDKFVDYQNYKSTWFMEALEFFARWNILKGEEDLYDPAKRWLRPDSTLLNSTVYVTLMRTIYPYDNSKIDYDDYNFSNPDTPEWSRPHVVRAIDEGFIDSSFDGYKTATRIYTMEQLVKVLGIDYQNADPSDLDFKDIDKLTETQKKIVKALSGIVEGTDDGYLNPDQTLNRAEIFTMLYRAYELDMIDTLPFYCNSYEIE